MPDLHTYLPCDSASDVHPSVTCCCCCRRLQLYYRSSARELRRLEASALSPLYSSFSEAVQGAATIRAAAAQQHFMKVRWKV